MNKNTNAFEISTFLKSLKEIESEAINHAEFLKKERKTIETQLSELNKIVGMLIQFTNINPDQNKSDLENTAGSRKEIMDIQLKNNSESQKPLEVCISQNSEFPDQNMDMVQESTQTIEPVVISKLKLGRNETVISVFESGTELTFPDIKAALIQKGIVWSNDEEKQVRACLVYLVIKKGLLGNRKIDKIRKVWFLKTSNNL